MILKISIIKRHPINSFLNQLFQVTLNRRLLKGKIYLRSMTKPYIYVDKKIVWLHEVSNFENEVNIESNTTWKVH